MRLPSNRAPTHPGKILLRQFLEPLEMSQQALADAIGVPFQRVNTLVNEKRGITPDTALRLGKFFGTTPDLWLNMQLAVDLYEAKQRAEEQGILDNIRRHRRREVA